MRRYLLAYALVLVPGAAGAQAARDSVRALDSAWARSYATYDTITARALFAPELIVTSGNGRLKTREGELNDVRPSPSIAIHYFRTEGADVRCYPGACVVAGLAQWEWVSGGRTTVTRRRYTATYVRGGSLGWQMLALHIGPAPEQ